MELKTAVQKISVLENELVNRENFYKQNIVALEERSAVMEEERNKALDREVDALKRLNEVKKETEMVGNKFSAKLKEEIEKVAKNSEKEITRLEKDLLESKHKGDNLTRTIRGLTEQNDTLAIQVTDASVKSQNTEKTIESAAEHKILT